MNKDELKAICINTLRTIYDNPEEVLNSLLEGFERSPESDRLLFFKSLFLLTSNSKIEYIDREDSLFNYLFYPSSEDFLIYTTILISYSEKARKEGILALEDDIMEVKNLFLIESMQLVMEGIDPEIVKSSLESMKNSLLIEYKEILKYFFYIINNRNHLNPETLKIFANSLWISEEKRISLDAFREELISILSGKMNIPNYPKKLRDILDLLSANLPKLIEEEILESHKFSLLKKQEDFYELMIRATLMIQSGDNPEILKKTLYTLIPAISLPIED